MIQEVHSENKSQKKVNIDSDLNFLTEIIGLKHFPVQGTGKIHWQ